MHLPQRIPKLYLHAVCPVEGRSKLLIGLGQHATSILQLPLSLWVVNILSAGVGRVLPLATRMKALCHSGVVLCLNKHSHAFEEALDLDIQLQSEHSADDTPYAGMPRLSSRHAAAWLRHGLQT